ncbi:S53 family peptidase [Kitasatospora brasiliensis]|uniref:S53 family peptidase n=1 Tax=Kitasatospora brasiliensis TaxID=3058040 RepID=UPI00292F63ED|nr:S8 family serine peptidase [Kitasatospora sp. K002]
MTFTSSTRSRTVAGLAMAAVTAVLVATPGTANATGSGATNGATTTQAAPVRDVCGTAEPGYARCFAELRTDVQGGVGVRGMAAASATGHAASLPRGLGPADLRAAYKLPATGGENQTVAIVDAGDAPTAEADLAVYRSTYGLPPCTTANGCFTKVNQAGTASPPPSNQGWSMEVALDLDMVSAACPNCRIILVEADSASSLDLAESVDTAVRLGATEVSNSYGATESGYSPTLASHYAHPGVAITVSSGDSGYGIASAPAIYPSVIAVGGTSLTKDSSARGYAEKAWSGAGSGCSAWIAKPAWQKDRHCPGRMVSDVSAVADPATGPAIYVTADGGPGWGIVGGTSASAPFIAGVIALGGHPERFADASSLYSASARAGLYDVVGGSNVESMDCGGDYQCKAVAGYDGPTGNGSPKGLSAFGG